MGARGQAKEMCTLKGRREFLWTAAVVSLLVLGPISVLGTVPAAHAVDPTTILITTSNGATVCPGSLHGAWTTGSVGSMVSDTCSITAVDEAINLSGKVGLHLVNS